MPLNEKQLEAVHHQGHASIIAPPGSGKSKMIEEKIKHTIMVVPEAQIVALSFTRDSSQNTSRRIMALVGKELLRRVKTGTFHSMALRQLKEAGYRFSILNEGQFNQFVQRAIQRSGLKIDIPTAKKHIESCRSNPYYQPTDDYLGNLCEQYVCLLRQSRSLDFAGILLGAVKLMERGKLPTIPCSHLFCDESQDMDLVQYAWCNEHIKAGATITMVGDDDQAIYSFRNGQGLNGMLLPQREHGARIITLNINYRSRQEILDVASNLISHNKNRIFKELKAHRGNGGIVELFDFKDSAKEANRIVKKIIQTSSSNHNPEPEKYSIGIREGEWAILGRNNHNLSTIEMALRANGIPHTTREQNLWDEQPVCHATSLLKSLITDERNGYDAALYFAGISQFDLDRCAKIFGCDDYEIFMNCAAAGDFKDFDHEVADEILQFTRLVQAWQADVRAKRDRIVIQKVFDWFMGRLKARASKEGKKYKKEISMLKSAKIILSGMRGSLSKRLSRLMTKPDNSNVSKEQGVYLGTLHASKGLEFKNVWICQVNDGVIPDIKTSSIEAVEEERRMLYVGVTRAEDSLFISYVENPSEFLFEAKLI